MRVLADSDTKQRHEEHFVSERAKSRKECKTDDGGVSRRQRPQKAESYPISCQLPLRMTLVPVCH